MPVSDEDLETAKAILARAGATQVLVFGTAATSPNTARDLDLACAGIPPERYFDVYGELMLALAVPVDLIDLADDTPLVRSARRKGRLLYARG